MKPRTRRIVWGVMVIVLITAGLALYHPLHEPIVRMALPDGTELRLEYVTYGTKHRAPGAGEVVVWATQFAQRWPRWGIPEHTEEYRYESGEPMLYLWFTHFDRRARKFLPDVDKGLSVEPAGDSEVGIFAVNHQFSGHNYDAYFENLSPMPHVLMGVDWYDRRKATLRLRVTMQGQTSELEVPNPAAKLSFPEWDPAPLPQTRRVGVLDVVLRSIQVSEDRVQTLSKETGQWEYVRSVDPEFEILRNGQKAEGLDIYQEHFMDPTGNRGRSTVLLSFAERAWKVRATVRRNDLYPLAGEGLTLGPVPLPEAGKYSVFPVPAEETKEGLGLVVLVGAGRYIWRDGVFEEIAEALSDRDEAAAFLYAERTPPSLRINATSPTLVFLFRAAESADEKKWTRGDNKVVRVKGNEPGFGAWEIENDAVGENFHGAGLARPIAYRLPGTDEEKKRSLPGAPVTVQIVPDEEEILEFFVAPPKVPEKAKETPE